MKKRILGLLVLVLVLGSESFGQFNNRWNNRWNNNNWNNSWNGWNNNNWNNGWNNSWNGWNNNNWNNGWNNQFVGNQWGLGQNDFVVVEGIRALRDIAVVGIAASAANKITKNLSQPATTPTVVTPVITSTNGMKLIKVEHFVENGILYERKYYQ